MARKQLCLSIPLRSNVGPALLLLQQLSPLLPPLQSA